jgi:hypothetical protein
MLQVDLKRRMPMHAAVSTDEGIKTCFRVTDDVQNRISWTVEISY